MKKFLKQLFCYHQISTTTETSLLITGFMIVSIIKCEKCKKTFPYRTDPESIDVLHSQIVRDYWMNKHITICEEEQK